MLLYNILIAKILESSIFLSGQVFRITWCFNQSTYWNHVSLLQVNFQKHTRLWNSITLLYTKIANHSTFLQANVSESLKVSFKSLDLESLSIPTAWCSVNPYNSQRPSFQNHTVFLNNLSYRIPNNCCRWHVWSLVSKSPAELALKVTMSAPKFGFTKHYPLQRQWQALFLSLVTSHCCITPNRFEKYLHICER